MDNKRDGVKKRGRPPAFSEETLQTAADGECDIVGSIAREAGVSGTSFLSFLSLVPPLHFITLITNTHPTHCCIYVAASEGVKKDCVQCLAEDEGSDHQAAKAGSSDVC